MENTQPIQPTSPVPTEPTVAQTSPNAPGVTPQPPVSPVPPVSPLAPADPKKGKSIKKIILGIGAVFVVLVIVILIGVFSNTQGVDVAADRVFSEMTSGQVEKVYEDSLFSTEMTYEKFSQTMGVGSGADLTKAKHLGWTGRGFSNNVKYIYGKFEFPNGKVQTITFEFIEQDGVLKLVGMYGGEPDGLDS